MPDIYREDKVRYGTEPGEPSPKIDDKGTREIYAPMVHSEEEAAQRAWALGRRLTSSKNEVTLAAAALKEAKERLKGAQQELEDVATRAEKQTIVVREYFDFPQNQAIQVWTAGDHQHEVFGRRPLTAKERKAAQEGLDVDVKPAFEDVLAACIDEAMTDRTEGRLVIELVEHLTTEKGLEGVTPEMVRDQVAGDGRYKLDASDTVMPVPVLTLVAGDAKEKVHAVARQLQQVADVIQAQVVSAGKHGVSVAAMVEAVKDATDIEVKADVIREVVETTGHLTITADGRVVRVDAKLVMRAREIVDNDPLGQGDHSLNASNVVQPDRHMAVRGLHLLRDTDEGMATTAGLVRLWKAHERKEKDEAKMWGPAPTKQELKAALAENADAKRKGLWWHLVALTPEQKKYIADKKAAKESGE